MDALQGVREAASESRGVDPKVVRMAETLMQSFPVQRRRRSAAEEEA